MKTKFDRLDSSQIPETAFLGGLALDELLGEFLYFLNHTPEGRECKKDLESSWQTACDQAREQKLIAGKPWTFAAWVKEVQAQLLAAENKSARENNLVKTEQSSTKKPAASATTPRKTAPRRLVKRQLFRGIK